jgi:hypothetical protein
MDLKAKAKTEAIMAGVKRETMARLTRKMKEIAARTIRKAPAGAKDVPGYQAEAKKKLAATQSVCVSKAKEAAKQFQHDIPVTHVFEHASRQNQRCYRS